MDPLDQLHPVFPLEIFSVIFDTIGDTDRTSAGLVPLDKDLDVLRACSLVCTAFLPLCRARIFECIKFGMFPNGQNMRIDRLVELLDKQPVLKPYIYHLMIGVTPDVTLKLDTLLNLPNVSTITLLHPRRQVSAALEEVWSFKIVEAYAKRGSLRHLSLRQSHKIPFNIICQHTLLHTLRLDGFYPPPIHSPSIKKLTLCQVTDFPTSHLSMYPNLETLEVLGTSIAYANTSSFDGQSQVPVPPPLPFGLKLLRIESGDLYPKSLLGIHPHRFIPGVVKLVHHIRDSAKLHGVRPFSQLEMLSMTLYPPSPSSKELFEVLEYLLGDAPCLSQFNIQFGPYPTISSRALLRRFQDANIALSLRLLLHTAKPDSLRAYSIMNLSDPTRGLASQPGSFPIDSIMDLVDQSNGDEGVNIDDPPGKGLVHIWEEVVTLIRARDSTKGSNVVHSNELLILYACVTPNGKGGKTRQEVEDSLGDVCNADGFLVGATVNGLRGDKATRATIVFQVVYNYSNFQLADHPDFY